MNILKYLFAAVPKCMSLVALLAQRKFMREPHLSGLVRITDFVRDDVMLKVLTLFKRSSTCNLGLTTVLKKTVFPFVPLNAAGKLPSAYVKYTHSMDYYSH